MSANKITGFFKKLSLSRLPRATNPATLEVFSSQECDTATPIVASFISSCCLEMDPSSTVPFNISLKPIRPALKSYPKNDEGNKFSEKWYADHTWLEYSKSKNAAFCFVCRHFGANSGNADVIYTKNGFTNFRKGPRKFKEHSATNDHISATHLYLERLASTDSVASKVSSHHQKIVSENRSYLTLIFQIIIWLCRQGLALRGHNEQSDAKNKGNFLELFDFVCKYNPAIKQRDETFHYKSAQIQNEIIDIVSKEIIKTILPPKCSYFSIIADETTDNSKSEQVCIVIRYLDEELVIHEKFVGFFDIDSTTAASLCHLILQVLNNLGLDYKSKMVGQCYDGAANMSGNRNGLHLKIREIADKALYVHCYAHQLNLALKHSCDSISKARNCLNTLNGLHDFIEGSAKRHAIFQSIQSISSEDTRRILHHLSDTRWASRDLSLNALKDSYAYVIKFLEVIVFFFK